MRKVRVGRLGGLAALAGCMLLAGPVALAHAADAWVAPNGSGSACTSASPCALTTQSDNNSVAGDTIFMRAGTYELTATAAIDEFNMPDLVMRPDPTNPPGSRVLIHNTNGAQLALSGNVHLQDVSFDASGVPGGGEALRFQGGDPLATRVDIVARGASGARGVALGTGDLVDSTVWVPSNSGVAVGGGSGTLRNVTAVASGPFSIGVAISGPNSGTQVEIQNSIVSGTQTDVSATDTGGDMTGPLVRLGYSNFDNTEETPPANVDPDFIGFNQANSPQLSNPTAGDFHQLAGSPTIDAANDAVVDTTMDIDGQPREVPANEPDIGADEIPASVAAPSLTGFSPPSPADNTNPSLLGSADPGSKIEIYTQAGCTGPIAATGFWNGLASPGIALAVPELSTTTFYAKANLSGTSTLGSGCSAGITYQELATPAPPPPGTAPQGPTGRRAAALKKCKKKKFKKARKKCRKRARKLPV